MTERTAIILKRLEEAYPDAHCELNFTTPLELITATVLSAQTTDRQVNKVTEVFFADCHSLEDFLSLSIPEIENYIHSLGFYHSKAEHLYLMWREIAERFHGEVPQTIDELVTLPGVGRKTANVVVANAFGQAALAVDTHVFRVSNRLGLCHTKTPEETELALKAEIDRELWSDSHHLLIFHGRRCCDARKPHCEVCPVAAYCEHFQGEKP